MLFFLLPWVTLILLVVFGLLMGWRMWRQQDMRLFPKDRGDRTRRRRRPTALGKLPLVPAALLRGADRTWVVFTRSGSDEGGLVERHLREAEPQSQITIVDASREPRLAEAFGIDHTPTSLLANKYGQVDARLIGLRAIEAYIEARA